MNSPKRVERRGVSWSRVPVLWEVPTTLQSHQSLGLRGVWDHPQVLGKGDGC